MQRSALRLVRTPYLLKGLVADPLDVRLLQVFDGVLGHGFRPGLQISFAIDTIVCEDFVASPPVPLRQEHCWRESFSGSIFDKSSLSSNELLEPSHLLSVTGG